MFQALWISTLFPFCHKSRRNITTINTSILIRQSKVCGSCNSMSHMCNSIAIFEKHIDPLCLETTVLHIASYFKFNASVRRQWHTSFNICNYQTHQWMPAVTGWWWLYFHNNILWLGMASPSTFLYTMTQYFHCYTFFNIKLAFSFISFIKNKLL